MPTSVKIDKKLSADGTTWRFNYSLDAPYNCSSDFVYSSQELALEEAKGYVAREQRKVEIANSQSTVYTGTI